jgi:hypothetical protein
MFYWSKYTTRMFYWSKYTNRMFYWSKYTNMMFYWSRYSNRMYIYNIQWNLSNPTHQGTREMCRIAQDVGKLRFSF